MEKRPLPPGAKRYSEQPEAKKVFTGARFDVYQWPQQQFDDSTATYEIVKRDDTVIVIPVIDGEIVLVKEKQPHWDKPAITLVAGMVKPDEDLAVAARRELEEETGLIFKDYTLVRVEPVVPGIEWFAYTFIATGYQGEQAKQLDPGEQNEVLRISLDELVRMTRAREFYYQPRFIEEMLMQDRLADLQQLLFSPDSH